MQEVFISRKYPNTVQSLGALSTDGFSCNTMELPWKDNKNNISCIPTGEYICKWTKSPRMSKEKLQRWLKANPGKTEKDCPKEEKEHYTYEIMDVPNRAGVRIHPANYSRQLLGCIALGNGEKDIDLDGLNDIIHSGNTCKKFNELMNKQDFKLIIT